MEKKWFADWFNSPYYHTLYKNRNDAEAEVFMKRLLVLLEVREEEHILDLACGKGRHAIYLNSKGHKVTGLDLAEDSIKHAQQFANESLRFDVHDMREVYPEKFNVILNLFTSFGYFDSLDDNQKVVSSIKTMLAYGGRIVIDFFNGDYVLKNLVPEETKTIDKIDFHITKWVENGKIYKNIQFSNLGKDYNFTEEVQALRLKDFEKLFSSQQLEICNTFGDYNLSPFDADKSERLILIVKPI
jgi:SAM-dependent methyltransferase